MPIVEKKSKKDNVLVAAKKRIKNIFDTSSKVCLSTSGGKDSISLSHLVYSLILDGEIDPKKLRVVFVDEEAMFDDVIDIVKLWRKRFLKVGVKFEWYCIQVKHYNCLNSLSEDESFITWDSSNKDKWVRSMPDFAITNHPLLKERIDTYQNFFRRAIKDSLIMVGVRMAESVHRRYSIASAISMNNDSISPNNMTYPIYDWDDTDIWKYIKDNDLEFPETYINLYKVGTPIKRLRISQFFSIDTARVLQKLNQYDHNLMDRVMNREPNAYLACLYWDSEMFRRPSGQNKKEDEKKHIDYKKECFKLIKRYEREKSHSAIVREIKIIIMRFGGRMISREWKKLYLTLKAGDVKKRSTRAILMGVLQRLKKEKV